MNQKEINDYNRRCAKLLQWEVTSEDGFICSEKYHNLDYESYYRGVSSNLLFHSNWEWIMEVLERIKYVDENQDEFFHEQYFSIDFKIDLLHGVELIIDEERLFLQTAFGKDQLKEAVVGGINEFLIWYEQNKL